MGIAIADRKNRCDFGARIAAFSARLPSAFSVDFVRFCAADFLEPEFFFLCGKTLSFFPWFFCFYQGKPDNYQGLSVPDKEIPRFECTKEIQKTKEKKDWKECKSAFLHFTYSEI